MSPSPHAIREQTPWKFRAKALFSPTVLVRGDAYFRQRRVHLQEATPREIRAVVLGTEAWRCRVLELNGRVHLECNCPHFRGGNACKHLWASILAADKAMEMDVVNSLNPLTAPKPPPATAPAARPTPTPTAKPQAPPVSWRALLLDADAAPREPLPADRWDGAPGHYLLRYELDLRPGAVTLTVIRQNVLKSGEPGRQQTAAPLHLIEEPDLPAQHRAILELLLVDRLLMRTSPAAAFERCPLSPSRLPRLLPLLADMGRCRVRNNGIGVADPLRRGEPFEAALVYEIDPPSLEKRRLELVYLPHLRLGDRQILLAEAQIFFSGTPLHCLVDGALHALPDLSPERLQALRRARWRIHVPKQEVRALFQTPEGARLPLPESLAPRTLPVAPPAPCLELDLVDGCPTAARLWLAYGDLEIACDDPRPAFLDADAWTRQERHREVEQQFLDRLEALGLPAEAGGVSVSESSLWALLERLEPLRGEGWTLRTRDKSPLTVGVLGPLRLEAGGSGQDWFELEGGLVFGDAIVPLPAAVRAFLRGERVVTLENGGLGVLPEAWLQRHAQALAFSLPLQDSEGSEGKGKKGRKDALRLHAAQLLALDEVLDQADGLAMDRTSAEWRRKVQAFAGVAPPEPPASFHGQLRPYQQETLGWLDFLGAFGFGGILADDMGLGKTIQALAWLALERERRQADPAHRGGPSLVVVPTSLLGTWQHEAARFCPSLRVCVYAGLSRAARTELAANFGEQDLVLVTYGLLRRDLEPLRRVRWQCLILDESQAVKNPDSQTAKAARALQAERRLCMTGTPLENRLDELWSQMHLCTPGVLGSRAGFEARFARPMSQPGAEEAAQARALLQRLLKPFILRRTKEAVAPELPEKQEAVLRCDMPAAQAKVYARLREHYRGEILAAVDTQGMDKSRFAVLEGLLRLRQAACHPALVGDAGAASGKLEMLSRVVREVVAEGHKALIFSQFTSFLALIRKQLDADGIAHAYLDGSTPAQTRAARVAAFQDPAGPPVFCISLKAGGVGLTLTAADYVFLMDPWWNPAVEAQAMDRAHRIGQTKKVFAYRLVSEGTIDEKVLALQDQKRDLAAILDEGATSVLSSLSREDLEVLLG
ncbi:DEAD/DEAH box helicase [Megalodesulfovibrio gigas]|uniref:SNF2-like protein n=1 Tax=Megalodesulfovibrio gigas (strain ATCC 19364 / DSM 1382 / NCIMB 9332 / VKM B-1759) TaxID=1121448 RepID=T2GG05_MEGG1|nr:DEAD/DEAH box helicase [Megalodesulfovibrio gigas]AGW15258.1 SNF2-like protein [Megalodesulfovibrio gigas DSM 1382 = ATCC 19364]